MFLAGMFICCGSSLLNRDWATSGQLSQVAWHGYSFQRALSICVSATVLFGLALAGAGLGMQAQRRSATGLAIVICAVGVVFWGFHFVVAAWGIESVLFSALAALLGFAFLLLLILSVIAASEGRSNSRDDDMMTPS